MKYFNPFLVDGYFLKSGSHFSTFFRARLTSHCAGFAMISFVFATFLRTFVTRLCADQANLFGHSTSETHQLRCRIT